MGHARNDASWDILYIKVPVVKNSFIFNTYFEFRPTTLYKIKL